MAKIKKNLSLEEDVVSKGMQRAKEIFGGNFSVYVSYLIYQDTKGIKLEENIEHQQQNSTLNTEVKNELDNILDMPNL